MGGPSAAGQPPAPASGGKTDLLFRFFESDFFDSWICLTYLYKSTSQGVLDYLCNRLYTLPEKEVERYLSQLCQLVYQRPGSSLERTYWLLLAISQDQQRNKHISSLRDRCEQAALNGYWELPFKETRLLPLSPPRGSRSIGIERPILSPSGKTGLPIDRYGSPDPFRRSRPMSPEPNRPMSPDGLGGGLGSSVFMDAGVEGLLQPSPINLRQTRQHVVTSPRASETNLAGFQTPNRRLDPDRVAGLRLQLGVGEGVTALLEASATAGEGGGPGVVQSDDVEITSPPFSPPNSPRRRQTTFGATLDFIDALCTASSGLTAFQPEDREWALRKVLQNINTQVERASRTGVAIWFPMGDSNLRVVRLAARESNLLNSREKAPFTLYVEVLDEELRKVDASLAADVFTGLPAPAPLASNSNGDRSNSSSEAQEPWPRQEEGSNGAIGAAIVAPAAVEPSTSWRGTEGDEKPLYRDSARSLAENKTAAVPQEHLAQQQQQQQQTEAALSASPRLQPQPEQAQPLSRGLLFEPEIPVVGCRPPQWCATAGPSGAGPGPGVRTESSGAHSSSSGGGSALGSGGVGSHHARSASQETTTSSIAAAALAAVKGSSAAGEDGAAANGTEDRESDSSVSELGALSHEGSPPGDLMPLRSTSDDPAAPPQQQGSMRRQTTSGGERPGLRPTSGGRLAAGGSEDGSSSIGGQSADKEAVTSRWSSPSLAADLSFGDMAGEQGLSPPRPRRLTEDLDAVSDEGSTPPRPEVAVRAPGGVSSGSSSLQFQLPGSTGSDPRKVAGGGTWIGGAFKHGGAYHVPPAAAAPAYGLVSGLSTALAGLRGEAPLVTVRFEVVNDRPLTAWPASMNGSQSPRPPRAGGEALTPAGGPLPPALARVSAASSAGSRGSSPSGSRNRRGSSSGAGTPKGSGGAAVKAWEEGVHQCSKSSWACKLGLCKLCNTRIDGDGEPELVQPQPYVRVHFVVQGGVDLSIKKTPPRHQRVPSHEAIAKVAKQHKVPLPPPVMPPPPLPPSILPAAGPQSQQQPRQQQQQQQGPSLEAAALEPQGPALAAANDHVGQRQQRGPQQHLQQQLGLVEQQASQARLGSPAPAVMSRLGAAAAPATVSGVEAAAVLSHARVVDEQSGSATATPSSRTMSAAAAAATGDVGSSTGGSRSSPGNSLFSSSSSALLGLDAATQELQRTAQAVYGEKWATKRARVQRATPHGRRPGWDLRCVIVKSGDDCRQELLAMQLIQAFSDIFQEAQLPLWLRTYEVLVTSNRTALIEMVPNAPSIHAIKAKSPPGTSLRDHFAALHVQGTARFAKAQRNFVESLSAYSLVCYLLQIRDRHNGNILLDDEGHIIHIDFGFMLSNSPGGVNFESAPFKLTREILEVMDSNSEGKPSELFDYFKVLMIQGFLAVRKHVDRITLLVEMMAGSGCPCFKSKVAAVQGLKKRLSLTAPEHQVVELVLGLISDSLDAWRTRQYDYYQRVLNGIL
ncbi:hypothetical protein N2152v2_007892 [Parachlorella kessleri]